MSARDRYEAAARANADLVGARLDAERDRCLTRAVELLEAFEGSFDEEGVQRAPIRDLLLALRRELPGLGSVCRRPVLLPPGPSAKREADV